ncbi:MAG: polyhydroxyalkanoate depolymerase [Pseudomonadota bacterium]
MYYHLHELTHAALSPWRAAADVAKLYFKNPLNPLAHTTYGRSVAAGCELFERTTRRYGKPVFDLPETVCGGEKVRVHERVVWSRPFCNLLHFERALPPSRRRNDPKLLIVAPMSGHYATLLRGTVEAMLPRHDVYITDWVDARVVPLNEGRFDLDDYVDYIISIQRFLGGDVHIMAVCQPSVPVLAAVARMEEDKDPYSPLSMTLMGGPIDTRINPTEVNKLAETRPIEWFRRNVIMKVPYPQTGFMRDVYPGFLQLSGFMSMNLDRHMVAHREYFSHLVDGDGDSAEKHREFYDEYLAVMDLTAEFYLQTVDVVFQRHALPKGEMTHRGLPVTPSKITKCALLTVEGEKDDISGVGQTEAAHALCTSLADNKRAHYVQPGVGHYGVFNGSRFRTEIAPRITDFILTHNGGRTKANGAAKPAIAKPAVDKPAVTKPAAVKPAAAKPAAAKPAAAKPAAPKKAPEAVPAKAAAPARPAKPAEAVKAAPKPAKRASAKPKAVDASLSAIMLAKPQGAQDDLKKISGVGPKLERVLNETGIFHYWQVAGLTAKQITELDDRLAFKGRIARDNWVEQAKKLAKETV